MVRTSGSYSSVSGDPPEIRPRGSFRARMRRVSSYNPPNSSRLRFLSRPVSSRLPTALITSGTVTVSLEFTQDEYGSETCTWLHEALCLANGQARNVKFSGCAWQLRRFRRQG